MDFAGRVSHIYEHTYFLICYHSIIIITICLLILQYFIDSDHDWMVGMALMHSIIVSFFLRHDMGQKQCLTYSSSRWFFFCFPGPHTSNIQSCPHCSLILLSVIFLNLLLAYRQDDDCWGSITMPSFVELYLYYQCYKLSSFYVLLSSSNE